jgi:hypothetical protein
VVPVAYDGEKTAETIDLAVTANIPIVGGKLASIITDQFVDAIAAEYVVRKAWLTGES